ncbi:MAG TPA: single-stranded DNA-binding protein [Acidimicrobiales bacterium]|nr:single-stranded DNA-binding protein [Acidimicrobiales bacterium]
MWTINEVAVAGRLSRPAEQRVLPSGGSLVSLEVTVPRAAGPNETVPVSWADAPAWSATLDVGQEVLVVGRVRRRFFRAGGATQSRTEVVAHRVVRLPAGRRARRVLAEVSARLEEAAAGNAP